MCDILNNKFYDEIIKGLQPLFSEQGLKESPDAPEIYLNDKKAVQVIYDDNKKMFLLNIADIIDGESVEFTEVSACADMVLENAVKNEKVFNIKKPVQ